MIRARRARPALSGALAILAVGATFGQRSADPALADPPLRAALERARAEDVAGALTALDALETALAPALDGIRRGGARVVAVDEPPGPPLRSAADALEAAVDEAGRLATALDAVAGSLAKSERPAPGLPTDAAELRAMASQLQAAATDGEAFAEMRRRAEETNSRLDRALASITGDRDPASALEHVGEARRLHEILAGWESGLVTLPIWLETTGKLLDAVQALAEATLARDPAAAAEAAERFETAVEGAREADVALDLAIAEGGSALARAPLLRLAAILDRIAATRAALASILHGTDAPAR